jgi:hypothetical protein
MAKKRGSAKKSSSRGTGGRRTGPSPRRGAPSRRKPPPPKRTPALLVVECDTDKLAADGISIARDLKKTVEALCLDIPVRFVEARTQDVLLRDLAALAVQSFKPTHVVFVGHMSKLGIRMARDLRVDWPNVPAWLEPFQPERVVVVGCEGGGRWLPSKSLFDGLPTLKEIYGSPVPHTEAQAKVVLGLVPYLLTAKRVKEDYIRFGQYLNFLLTGGILFWQRRRDFHGADPWAAAGWTLGEEIVKSLLLGGC